MLQGVHHESDQLKLKKDRAEAVCTIKIVIQECETSRCLPTTYMYYWSFNLLNIDLLSILRKKGLQRDKTVKDGLPLTLYMEI